MSSTALSLHSSGILRRAVTPPTPTDTRRSGRRPGRPATREAILASAQARFARDGYTATSMRAIARDAQVDAALVVHYFGSKDGLLRATLELDTESFVAIPELMQHGLDAIGERLIGALVDRWDSDADDAAAMRTILSIGLQDPLACDLLHTFVVERLTAPLTAAIASRFDVGEAELRAELAAAQIIGLATARNMLRLDRLAALDRDEITRLYGPLLQSTLTGPMRGCC
jgi:AcrR family transcriptional regulator